MAAPSTTGVDLGFVEENYDPRLLKSRFFPSKLGGRPSWLSLSDLPTPSDLSCLKCGKPCVFLLQVYAPYEQHSRGFHRAVFIFVCRNPSCCTSNCNNNFRVFRSQLPKENDFYSPLPPDEFNPDKEPEWTGKVGVALCVVCGSAGPKRCAQCHTTSYCGKDHQTLHWKAGHKKRCCHGTNDEVEVPNLLFPEVELVMEEETSSKDVDCIEKSEAEKIQEYQEYLKASTDKESSSLDKVELEKSAVSESPDDKQFARFKARIAVSPDQVMRYKLDGEPLLIAATHTPKPSDIPGCSCGASRQFEFQILPQLLIHLKVDSLGDSIDWGTLCVYTCSESCDIGNKYQEEFLWKQDITGPGGK